MAPVRPRVRTPLVAAALALASVASTARADEPGLASLGDIASLGDVPELHVAASLSTASRTDEGLVWRVRIVLAAEEVRDFQGGLVRFAVPLPEGEVLEPAPGIVPLFDHGRLAGIGLGQSAPIDSRAIDLTLVQPTRTDGEIVLGAPLAVGRAVQIVESALAEDARLEIVRPAGLERNVGFVAARGVSPAAREEAARLTGYTPHVSRRAVYVRGDDVRDAAGLVARVETTAERAARGYLGAGVAFVGIALGLAFAARRLRHAASVERADALLAAEIHREARRTAAARDA